jgi:hypothetical protein
MRASRLVAGTASVEMEPCVRLREIGSARKPEGVRVVVWDDKAASAAIERSRRALALSRFSSCVSLVGAHGRSGRHYDSSSNLWGWW